MTSNRNSTIVTKLLFTAALAATAFLLSPNANAQSADSGKLPSAELAVKSENLLSLKLRVKELKELDKATKAQAKLEKAIKKEEKMLADIAKLCAKPALKDSQGCKS